jgi:MoaA/NifB/PqqE/SkfB family radical SAM enzyme
MIVETISQDAARFRRAVRAGEAYPPLMVKIKVSYACNLRCVICNHWRTPREEPLPMSHFMETVRELAALGCRKLHLSGGEPLLRPELPELVSLATSLGLRVTMTTNGTLLNKETARQLVRVGLRGVNLSIDSPDRKTHDRMRGKDGAWKQALRAAAYLQRYRKKGRPVIRMNTVISNRNYATLGELPDFAQQHGIDQINLISIDDFSGVELAMRRKQIEKYNAEIAPRLAGRALELGLIDDEKQVFPFGRTPEEIKKGKKGQYAFGWYEKHACYAPWFHSLIDYNGLVYLCCMTREQTPPLGDIKATSFTEIWEGKLYQEARTAPQPLARSICRRCDNFLMENRALHEAVISSDPRTYRPDHHPDRISGSCG